MSEKMKSVYTLGAEDGLVIGPLMAATVVLIGASTYVPWLALVGWVFIVAVPVVAYIRLASTRKVNPAMVRFSPLWLRGICMFFFGGLIMAIVSIVMMRWVVPDFMKHLFDNLIEVYGKIDDPAAAQVLTVLRKVEETNSLPTPLDVALEMLYFAVFSGSILSMIYAVIIKRRSPVPPRFNGFS